MIVAETARVIGDVVHEKLSVETGAYLEGNCRHMSAGRGAGNGAGPKVSLLKTEDADAKDELASLHDDFGRLFFDEGKLMLARFWAIDGVRLEEAERLAADVLQASPGNRGAEILLMRIRQRLGR